MLVFCKNPRGVLQIGHYKVWGRETGQVPCDLPLDLYLKCREALEDATYREGTLSKMFNKPFPEVAFRYSELKSWPDHGLDRIGPLIVDNYSKKWSHKKKVDQIKVKLRES